MIRSPTVNGSGGAPRRPEPEHWKQWLRQAQAGNRASLNSLLNELQPWLVGFVREGGFNEADAWDITQVTLLRFYQRLARFDPSRGNVRSWVAQIARNHIIDLWRARARHQRVPLPDEEPGSDRDEPSSRLEREEQRTLIQKAINDLKDSERTAVLLRFEDDMTFREMSQRLRVPLGTAVARVRRGIRSVRRRVGEAVSGVVPA
jgi:RNA polymerase sigma-70 factor (ECF subfamily)